MSRPTQADVARLAGVSKATVSYVINKRSGGKVQITEETRRRVLQAIDELGYQVDVTARSLRTQQTHLLAIMVPDLTNPFYPLLIRGAQAIAEENDYQILVYDCDDRPERERSFVEAMLRRRVDGVILNAFFLQDEEMARLTKAGIQVVVINDTREAVDADIVGVANQDIVIQELVKHLVDKGHRRIAHLAGRQDTPPGRSRLQDYRKALLSQGLSYDESIVAYGTFRREGVAEAILPIFCESNQENRPTALFAANDLMAIEAIRVLTRYGRRVPEDVAVCGFDNIPEAEVVMPTLTTIEHTPQLIGRKAAELLLERLTSKEAIPQRQRWATSYRLVIREST